MSERYEHMASKLTQPLKWHGGKGAFGGQLAQWIISLMPPHVHYVETHFGGGSVLLNKDPEGISEVVNDINFDLTTFWSVLSDPEAFPIFRRAMETTPFSQPVWNVARDALSWGDIGSSIDRARWFFICCRQSRAGQMNEFAPLSRNRTRRGMNEQASAWLTAVEGLPAVHARLKRVAIVTEDALTVIRREDGPKTLFYCDPPYLHETRASTADYEHEMTRQQHEELLECLATIKGRFLLSGYRSSLYDDFATGVGWKRHEFKIPNNASGGKKKRVMTECVWSNDENG